MPCCKARRAASARTIHVALFANIVIAPAKLPVGLLPGSAAMLGDESVGGYVVGHFIKYVDTIGGGGTGDTCDFSSFGSCVAVLTK